MATADTPDRSDPGGDAGADPVGSARTRRLLVVGPIAVLLLGAAVLGVVLWGDRAPEVAPEPDPVQVEASSAYDFSSVTEMVAASDLVVRARVVDTSRGDLLGADGADPGGAGLVVREVTLQIDDVLHTALPAQAGGVGSGDRVVVAEEGWLTTGEPLIVDGLGPSTTRDDGIWFLQAIPATTGTDAGAEADEAEPSFLVINSQGRYLVDDGRLTGAEGDDPLVQTIEGLTPDELASAARN